LGRFYYRAWSFGGEADGIDWELNLLLADPSERGKGYGTAAQKLAADSLLKYPDTQSVFAYTAVGNTAVRRALQKAGFAEVGLLPHAYYRVELPPHPCVLYSRQKCVTFLWMDVVIRTYTSADLEACRALWVELTEHHRQLYDDPTIGGEQPGLAFDAHLARVGPDRIWVAEAHGTVYGLVGLIVEGDEGEEEGVTLHGHRLRY
jgi:hypothetical protein